MNSFSTTFKPGLILIIIYLTSCGNTVEKENNLEEKVVEFSRDLNEIYKRDTLKAICIYGPTSYFLYKGQAMGFEYEILEDITEKLGLNLELIISKNMDSLFTMLNNGDGDLIAYGLTVTQARKEHVAFTVPYTTNYQVLVQRKPEDWKKLSYTEKQNSLIRDVTELGGKTLSVRENSSYLERIDNLSQEIGDSIEIEIVPGEYSIFDIIQKVSEGEYDYTLADNNIAQLNKTYYPNIDISVAASLRQNIAWATRKNSIQLKQTLDSLLWEYIGSARFNIIYEKYFGNSKAFKKRISSDYYSLKTGAISPYDELIKKYSTSINWDWQLLSSVIYQESHFDPKAGSWAGAHGLMQLMPVTAKELGVKNTSNPEQSIKGGCKYLDMLYERWTDIPDSIQRIKFTLASYNCGYGHVVDAQKLAEINGDSSLVWDEGVDAYILKLAKPKFYNNSNVKYGYTRGTEPYNYVKDIFSRYYEYKEMVGSSE